MDTRMAKPKKEYEAPKTMTLDAGEGLEDASISFKLQSEEKDKDGNVIKAEVKDTIKVRVPVLGAKAGAGLKAFQNACNTAGKNGNEILATTVRNAAINQAKAARLAAFEAGKDLPDVLTLVPEYPNVRTTDEAEAMGAQIAAGIKAGTINPADLAKLFGSAVKK